MLVYGRNVAKEILKNNKKINKIIIQKDFFDKEINSYIEKSKFNIEILDKKDIYTILTIIVAITNDIDRSQANSSN